MLPIQLGVCAEPPETTLLVLPGRSRFAGKRKLADVSGGCSGHVRTSGVEAMVRAAGRRDPLAAPRSEVQAHVPPLRTIQGRVRLRGDILLSDSPHGVLQVEAHASGSTRLS